MIALVALADAVTREDALQHAAEYATHEWTMTAVNETASCSDDYESDFTAGTWVGVPYDWGGWYTLDEFDAALAEGLGAGSHSWHGSLWCTAGVDCSGFVSQVWETDQKYGTATFHEVTHDIGVDELLRADALNDAGSHVVLFAYETAAGIPVHYEAGGDPVLVDNDQGWSAFASYTPIRYDAIEDGPSTGTTSEPIAITAFPFRELRWTAGAASDVYQGYSCSDADESGPEVVYRFETPTGGRLELVLSDDDDVDVDLHVLDAPSAAACVARADGELVLDLVPGAYWIVADTYVGSREFPGPYYLAATFDGEVGPVEVAADTGDTDEDVVGESPDASGEAQRRSGPPGALVAMAETGGCGCGTSPGAAAGLAAALAALLATARRHRHHHPSCSITSASAGSSSVSART